MFDLSLETRCLHSDETNMTDISCPLHVSTTYRYHPSYNDNVAVQRGWLSSSSTPDQDHTYSRNTTETRTRLETVLGNLEGGAAVTYSSGLAAIFALFQALAPKRILMSKEGYHGVHGVIDLYKRGRIVVSIFIALSCD